MTMTTMQSKRHELLSDIEAHVAALLKDYNLESEACEQVGVAVVDFIAAHLGGQVISFPKDYYYKLANRDMAIYAKFRGDNWHELVAEFNMTESGIRKVINRVRKAILKQRQPDLFVE
jgi:Mor family transcriptional regulator